MRLSVSKLRADLYRIVDRVLEGGEVVEIERRGRRVRLVPVTEGDALEALRPHPGYLRGDPEDLVHVDWSHEWRP